MSMQGDGNKARGRSYDQVTKGGSSSAATMGSGGTGDRGAKSGAAAGNAQLDASSDASSDARTDDWLSSGSDQEREQGFRPSDPGALRTGMEGIGNRSGGKPGNRQNDWGHSEVGAGNEQSESRLDDVVGSDTGRLSEEAGELQTGPGGTESLSTGNAGSRQADVGTGRSRQ